MVRLPAGIRGLIRSIPRSKVAAVAVVIGWALASCAPAVSVRILKLDKPKKTSVLAVYPFEFRWSEPAYRSFQLGWLEAMDLIPYQRWAIYGPGEFHIREPSDDNAFAATDIASVLSQQGYRPEEILVVRAWAEKQEQRSSRQIYDSNGKPVGQRLDAQITLIAHMEVVDPWSRQVIAEIQATGQEDPFATPDETDPSPVLTRLVRTMSGRLADALGDLTISQEEPRTVPFQYSWNPSMLYEFEDQGRPSLESQLATLDPVSRDAFRSAPLRYFSPGLTDAQITELEHLQGGLWISRIEPSGAESSLQVGDLITAIEGGRATPLLLARFPPPIGGRRQRELDGPSREGRIHSRQAHGWRIDGSALGPVQGVRRFSTAAARDEAWAGQSARGVTATTEVPTAIASAPTMASR